MTNSSLQRLLSHATKPILAQVPQTQPVSWTVTQTQSFSLATNDKKTEKSLLAFLEQTTMNNKK